MEGININRLSNSIHNLEKQIKDTVNFPLGRTIRVEDIRMELGNIGERIAILAQKVELALVKGGHDDILSVALFELRKLEDDRRYFLDNPLCLSCKDKARYNKRGRFRFS
ncbi:MAG: hypothetical protein KAI57_04425 [Candidatus Pacebacteria bacterium]|nr:hypothetical protein [Candidatus Paceibacterota bacterium]